MSSLDVLVPDIGDFTDVPIVEMLVAVGDEVEADAPLMVLESDKASMEIPAPQAGKVAELKVDVGDKVSQGTVIAVLEVSGDAAESYGADGETPAAADEAPARPKRDGDDGEEESSEEKPSEKADGEKAASEKASADERGDVHAGVLVLGSGPGGYAAAFRAADLGQEVVLVERYATLGGVCLNVGCIPSKALLHAAKVVADAESMGEHGLSFGKPDLDLDALRGWKDEVVAKLVKGVTGMAKSRKVKTVQGDARFTGPHMLEVSGEDGTTTVSFDHAIVAAGSRAVQLPDIPMDDPRVMDSTSALELEEIPERLLVIGGGIIGLEMATVYDALGSAVTVVELADQIIPGCDKDLVKPLMKRISERYEAIHLGTKVETLTASDEGVKVEFSGDVPDASFDRVLVAVGRVPNGAGLGLDAAGVDVDDRGFVSVDDQQRTNVEHIYAIGDVAQPPLLAHKASAEGHVAAEVIAGHDVAYDVRAMPSVAYTEPEVAWVGLTETEAKADDTKYEKAAFPWSASGRALAMDGASGSTKLLFDPETRRVLGGGVVGPNAGELVAEIGLAIEMGADVEDVGLTVHAHPTLSETVGLAAELAAGTITDLPNPAVKKKK
ncbi:MAG: Dihydrolipoamide dehydrogenase of pyruvate dehydrogenase complex [uncultured Solirubrobacteraceae bacterium]|uniref:Dihydrolipoyl dehydrogenase n=1 Tax=uncultured Solirubrobacteraceae bacterium TaxID=1162706 RepID=A0A6J4RQU7_9ACTN|nr:MAG: Dihydrolipoamide dehydrogenase of pyruvate dehydrogenase complex [uncultured Solirubrobacteraceae bacterium]